MQEQPVPGQTVTPDSQHSEPSAAPESNWQFTAETAAQPAPANGANDQVSWTASEFMDHQKEAGWYLLLIGGGLVLAALIYLLTKDVVSTVIVVVALAALGFFAGRKPRTLPYQLDHFGVQVGQKNYAYGLFKSFSVIDEGVARSITLVALQRFMPPLSIFYDPKDEQQIIDIISNYLPMEHAQLDIIERLMRRIHF